MKTARAEGPLTMTGSSSGNTGNTRIGCYAVPAVPDQMVCLWCWSALCRVGGGWSRLCGFFALFYLYKQATIQFVWFLDPIFLINRVISSIYSCG